MKHVEFSRDMSPYKQGERRLVPDDVAARLEAAGDIKPNAPDFPAKPDAQQPTQQVQKPRRYLTKGQTNG